MPSYFHAQNLIAASVGWHLLEYESMFLITSPCIFLPGVEVEPDDRSAGAAQMPRH